MTSEWGVNMSSPWEMQIKKIWANKIKSDRKLREVLAKTKKERASNQMYPYIVIGYRSSEEEYKPIFDFSKSGFVRFPVRNDGKFAALNCYAQVYRSDVKPQPEDPYLTFKDCHLIDQTIFTLQAGEERIIELRWKKQRELTSIIIACFDPILDPLESPLIGPVNRHKKMKLILPGGVIIDPTDPRGG